MSAELAICQCLATIQLNVKVVGFYCLWCYWLYWQGSCEVKFLFIV